METNPTNICFMALYFAGMCISGGIMKAISENERFQKYQTEIMVYGRVACVYWPFALLAATILSLLVALAGVIILLMSLGERMVGRILAIFNDKC